MEEFPSNSRTQKEEVRREKRDDKRVTRVVEGDVVRRKKPLGRRFREIFLGGDTRGVWGFIAFEVLVPAAKDMMLDAVREGAERMIFPESRGSARRNHRRGGPTPYHRYSGNSRDERDHRDHPTMSRRGRQIHNFDEIILPSRVEAEEVIDQMFEIISSYNSVSVEDLYNLVGIEPSYVDRKWGWYDMRGSGVTRIKGGYLLDLDKPEPLD